MTVTLFYRIRCDGVCDSILFDAEGPASRTAAVVHFYTACLQLSTASIDVITDWLTGWLL